MVQLTAQRRCQGLELAEVQDPGVGREPAFDLDDQVVVVAVQGLGVTAEGGEVSGGEPQSVALNDDLVRGHRWDMIAWRAAQAQPQGGALVLEGSVLRADKEWGAKARG